MANHCAILYIKVPPKLKVLQICDENMIDFNRVTETFICFFKDKCADKSKFSIQAIDFIENLKHNMFTCVIHFKCKFGGFVKKSYNYYINLIFYNYRNVLMYM